MPAPNEDQALVEKYLRRRDEHSFRELYRRHSPALYALALRLSDTDADAEDALQETWIRACRLLSSFQWKSTLRTWLTGILINCVREIRRKHERRGEESIDDLPPPFASEAPADNLESAICKLPVGYRQVLVLHDLEGYTHEEISRMLEINVGTSKSQLHHARKFIRSMLIMEQTR
jgi:RNA polymerase sigma-70 factor, ECF subfamily